MANRAQKRKAAKLARHAQAATATKVRHVEAFDNFAPVRNQIRLMAAHSGEYAGVPLPIDGEELVVEPTYRFASVFNKPKTKNSGLEHGEKIRNTFWSWRYRCDVTIIELANGRIEKVLIPPIHRAMMEIRTAGCSVAWGVEQESNALQTLAGLLRHHMFKQYLLTGIILEKSRRSGLFYVFRKLRPTLVLAPTPNDNMTVLAALCLHPIAHYDGSWAGAMCPTDDVIAHLQMMRADEHLFWRRANQHAPYRPEAGL